MRSGYTERGYGIAPPMKDWRRYRPTRRVTVR